MSTVAITTVLIFLLQLLGTSPMPLQRLVLQLLEALLVGAVGMTISALASDPVGTSLVIVALSLPVLIGIIRWIYLWWRSTFPKTNAVSVEPERDQDFQHQDCNTATVEVLPLTTTSCVVTSIGIEKEIDEAIFQMSDDVIAEEDSVDENAVVVIPSIESNSDGGSFKSSSVSSESNSTNRISKNITENKNDFLCGFHLSSSDREDSLNLLSTFDFHRTELDRDADTVNIVDASSSNKPLAMPIFSSGSATLKNSCGNGSSERSSSIGGDDNISDSGSQSW